MQHHVCKHAFDVSYAYIKRVRAKRLQHQAGSLLTAQIQAVQGGLDRHFVWHMFRCACPISQATSHQVRNMEATWLGTGSIGSNSIELCVHRAKTWALCRQ